VAAVTPVLAPDTRAELADAWATWDAYPHDKAIRAAQANPVIQANRAVTGRHTDALATAADQLGWSAPRLHDALVAARRAGHDHYGAVDLVDALYDAGEDPTW
jgi:hypothetical protein